MEGNRICSILEWVAQREGTTAEKVLFEIEAAISLAYRNAILSNDENLIRIWKEIPCKGNMPTATEMISYLSERILKGEGEY